MILLTMNFISHIFFDMRTTNNSFRNAVLKWLSESNTSVSNLAAYLGIASSTLHKYLTGETENISLGRALEIAKLIGFRFEVD